MMSHRKYVSVEGILVLGFCTLLPLAGRMYGQTASGQVNGTVTDPAGAAIAGARVVLLSQATSIQSETQTNTSGFFTFVNVQPGSYVLSVETAGFKTAHLSNFTVAVN